MKITIIIVLLTLISSFSYAKDKSNSSVQFSSYSGSLRSDSGNKKNGAKFNKFMLSNEGKTVFLSIYLDDDEIKNFRNPPGELGAIVFTISDISGDIFEGGAEYLVQLPKGSSKKYEINKRNGKLTGYFEVYGVNGPRQGYLSISLGSVNAPK